MRKYLWLLLLVGGIAIAQTAFLEPKNAAYSQLAGAIDADDTEITVTTGHGDRFPDGTRDFHLALSNAEIVKCTARTGDVLTIVRAQEGTVAQAHFAGATVRLTVSAQYVSEIQTAVNALETDWDAHPDLTEGAVLVGDASNDPVELTGTTGQVIKHNGTGWAAGTDITGGTMSSFTAAGDSGSSQTISNGDTLTISGGGGLTTTAGATDKVTVNLPSGTSGQVLKHNGTAWAAGADADTNTTYSAGTGLSLATTTFALSHLGIQSLADPNADRIFFWDDSETAAKWLTLGSNLSINGTTINATDTDTTYTAFAGDSGAGGAAGLVPAPGAGDTAAGKYLKASGGWATPPDTNTTYSAGTGLNLATTTFSLSHLGIQSLTDPDDDRIFFWHDGEGAAKWLDIGTNLEISGTTLNATGGGSLPSGSEHQTLRYDDPNGWEAAANLTNTGTLVAVRHAAAGDGYPLDIFHAYNSDVNDEIGITFSATDYDGGATPTVGKIFSEVMARDGNESLDVDLVMHAREDGTTKEWLRMGDGGTILRAPASDGLYLDNKNSTAGAQSQMNFSLWNSSSLGKVYAAIQGEIVTNTASSEAGKMIFRTTSDGTIGTAMTLNADKSFASGSGPTTLTNSSGKVLMSALEKTTYSVIYLQCGGYYNAYLTSNYTNQGTGLYESTAGADSIVQFSVGVPTDYKSGGAIIITIFATMLDAFGNNLYLAKNTSETTGGVGTPGTYFTLAAPANSTTLFKIQTTYSSGISGVVAGDFIGHRLDRDADHASDSNAGKINLKGIMFEFER